MKKSTIRSLQFFEFCKVNIKLKIILFLIGSFLKMQANPKSNIDLLTLHLEKVSIENVFSQVEKISEYRFLFETIQIPSGKEITINVENKTITEVLNHVFNGLDITYNINGRQVIITKIKINDNNADPQDFNSLLNPLKQTFQQSFKGTVLDNLGQPLPGANILEKGTINGTLTDFDGNFSIQVPGDATLIVSYIGFETKEVAVNNQSNIKISLEIDSQQLTEVVVTALGISREKKSLGYATQEVAGDDVNNVPRDNVVNSLSGRVAGVQIKSNSNLGGSSNVVIRGSTSLTGNNQALFVVDGVPVNNSNYNSNAQQTGGGGFDYGNLASDIDPNNIKSINILKGAAATALYGSRATNGAVIITTKNGAGSINNPTVTINSSATMGFIDKSTWPKFQYEYGTGYGALYGPNKDSFFNGRDVNGDGIQDLVTPSTAYGSYGGLFNPNLQVYQWDSFYPESANYLQSTPWEAPKDKLISFFETPITLSNSVSIAGGSKEANYRISYTKFDQDGMLPNSKISRDNIAITTSFDVNEKLTASASANYIKTNALGRNKTGNETGANAGNVMAAMRKYWAMNVGIQELKEAYFTTGSSVDPFMGGTIDNPYWSVYENYQNDTRDRIFGNVALKNKFTDWLNVEGRVSLDTYSFFQEERVNEGTAGAVGLYVRNNINFTEMNYDLMVNFNKYVTDKLNISGVLGTNIRRNNFSSISASTNGGLVLPSLFSLSNSKNLPNAPIEIVEKIGVDGIYGLASFGYDNTLYLDVTGRFDHSSTLPSESSTYFYPSVSTSFIFSNLIGDGKKFSFGKLRLNYAEVGSSAPANSLTDVLNKPTPFGAVPLYGVNSTKNNEALLPESTVSIEGGLELRFFENKLRLDMSVYKTNSKDQIIPVAISTATGYSSKFVNAGEIENKGIEFAISSTVLSSEDFSWDVNLNWAKNRSEVLSLFEGGNNLQLGAVSGVTINASVGEPYGTIRGTDFVYLDGKRLINQTTGEYERTTTSDNAIGNITPDWNGGISNSIRYKKLSVSFLIDIQKGGDVHSSDIATGNRSGLYNYSVGLNDLGNPIRNSLKDGGGIILDGVAPNGSVNTVRTAMDSYRNAIGSIKSPNAAFVYDASYVKLREVTLRYALPKIGFLDKANFKSVIIGLVGSNLWIIHKNLPFADPEYGVSSGNLQGFQNGAYPTTRQLGLNIQLQF
jgi:TonB-linked SusC/RagA family outer membrane protein